MAEERKHAILLAATLLCARKLMDLTRSDKSNLSKQYWVDQAFDEAGEAAGEAAFILEKIDKRWPGNAVSEK